MSSKRGIKAAIVTFVAVAAPLVGAVAAFGGFTADSAAAPTSVSAPATDAPQTSADSPATDSPQTSADSPATDAPPQDTTSAEEPATTRTLEECPIPEVEIEASEAHTSSEPGGVTDGVGIDEDVWVTCVAKLGCYLKLDLPGHPGEHWIDIRMTGLAEANAGGECHNGIE